VKHSNNCIQCKREFQGRKNQKFCSLSCKADYNNWKAFKLRKELIDNNIMQKNYLILKYFYALKRNHPIALKDLIKKGFETISPSRLLKSPVNGYEIRIIHGYGYRIYTIKNIQYAIIYKREEINNF
jgi:hypothetical protein